MSHSDKYFILSDYPLLFKARRTTMEHPYMQELYHIFVYTGKKWIITHDSREFYGDITDWTARRGFEVVAIVRIIPKTV